MPDTLQGLVDVPVDTATPIAPFTILAVCTGNICRSPMLQSMLDARLGATISDWQSPGERDHGPLLAVRSAGTRIDPALEQPPQVSEHLRRLGVPSIVRPPVALSLAKLADADLVLTVTREQRSAVVRMSPRMVSKSFTLVEFARIVDSLASTPRSSRASIGSGPDVPAVLRATTTMAARRRGMVPPLPSPSHLDIVDPYRRSDAVYASVADAIAGAVDEIVHGLSVLTSR
ncbi:MAG: hypothetical protein WAK00_07360 [Microbacterium sp.]|uniref:arsenate reductase/protein-tyrosine-phosphatase family protein n=1 Tax=Microbacterium sp. TaxID=51671 RepID=UPI003BAF4F25